MVAAYSLAWLRGTPLGRPVVPDVYSISAVSAASTGASGGVLGIVATVSSNAWPRHSRWGCDANCPPSTRSEVDGSNTTRRASASLTQYAISPLVQRKLSG